MSKPTHARIGAAMTETLRSMELGEDVGVVVCIATPDGQTSAFTLVRTPATHGVADLSERDICAALALGAYDVVAQGRRLSAISASDA